MERFVWRYQPEFTVTVLINDQAARGIQVLPSASAFKSLAAYGLIARTNDGTLSCFGRQLLNGTDWVPAYPITHPLSFSFWISVLPENPLHVPGLFNERAVMFGKPVFYSTNLSSSGEIDAGLAGNTLELIPDPSLIDEKKGALSTYTPAAKIAPGDYTLVKAGKIRAGAAVEFNFSRPVSSGQAEIGLDFRSSPGEVFQVVLEGDSLVREQVIPDEQALAAGVHGVVTIFKDSWRAPEEPITYRINFIT